MVVIWRPVGPVWSLVALISSRKLAACSKSSAVTALSSFFCKCLQAFGQVPALPQGLRHFADVPGALVHGLEQALQALGKSRVALRAAQPAGFLEIRLGEAAIGAFDFLAAAGLRDLLRRAQAEQQVGQRKAGRVVDALLLGALLAQIHLLHLVADDLGQMNRGRVLFAKHAQHTVSMYHNFKMRMKYRASSPSQYRLAGRLG